VGVAVGQARQGIWELLRTGPTPVGEIAAQLPVGRPAVSKHLRVLSGAGLTQHESVGTRNLYALAPDGFAIAQQWMVGTLGPALSACAGQVSRTSNNPVRGRSVMLPLGSSARFACAAGRDRASGVEAWR